MWFISAFFWGVQDSFLDVNNNAIAVSEYSNAADGSAAYTSVQMLSCFILYILASIFHESVPIIILGIEFGMLIIAYVCSMFFEFKKRHHHGNKKEEKLAISQPEEHHEQGGTNDNLNKGLLL